MQLRPYADADASACCNVINAAVAGMEGLNAAARALVRAKNVPTALGRELREAFTLVGEDGGEVCAVGCLSGAEIKRLYVEPAAQHRGLGRALVASLEQEARRHGLPELRVDASPSSVAFYARLGFVVVRAEDLRRGDAMFRFVVMTKQLSAPNRPE